MSYKLKNNLVTAATDPATVAELVTLCNHLDMRRRALQSESQTLHLNTTPRMGATGSATTASSTSSGTAPGPMDLLASRPRLTAEERRKGWQKEDVTDTEELGTWLGSVP